MTTTHVRTNRNRRCLFSGYELRIECSPQEYAQIARDYDYLGDLDETHVQFFKYHGQWYAFDDSFQVINSIHCDYPYPKGPWTHAMVHSAWDATLVYLDNSEMDAYVVVGAARW